MICIINYGGGNVKSVTNLLKSLNYDFLVTNNEKDILNAEKIIFPGQGHFGQSMSVLKEQKLILLVIKQLKNASPFLEFV